MVHSGTAGFWKIMLTGVQIHARNTSTTKLAALSPLSKLLQALACDGKRKVGSPYHEYSNFFPKTADSALVSLV
jgi:hypothetical protein